MKLPQTDEPVRNRTSRWSITRFDKLWGKRCLYSTDKPVEVRYSTPFKPSLHEEVIVNGKEFDGHLIIHTICPRREADKGIDRSARRIDRSDDRLTNLLVEIRSVRRGQAPKLLSLLEQHLQTA